MIISSFQCGCDHEGLEHVPGGRMLGFVSKPYLCGRGQIIEALHASVSSRVECRLILPSSVSHEDPMSPYA